MALEAGGIFLKENMGYYLKNEYDMAVRKIKSTIKAPAKQLNINHQSKITNSQYLKEKETVLIIQKAIGNRKKLKIKYFSMGKRKSSIRIVHPYMVYSYEGFLYLVAYCENNQQFRDFKIIRIENIEMNDEGFELLDFSFDEFMRGSFGIFKDDELNIKLRIKYPHSIYVKESVYIKNQRIEEVEDGDIIFNAVMSGKPEIMSWIKSMGANVEILEPKELRKELIEEIEKMKEVYLME